MILTTSGSTFSKYLSFVVARTWERLCDVSPREQRESPLSCNSSDPALTLRLDRFSVRSHRYLTLPNTASSLLLIFRMIRTKGEAGTGDVVEAVKHQRKVMADIRKAAAMSDDELYAFAKDLAVPYHLLKETARLKRLPVVR